MSKKESKLYQRLDLSKRKMAFTIGIDPGLKGGICVLNSSKKVVFLEKCPTMKVYNKMEIDRFAIADMVSWTKLYGLGARSKPQFYIEKATAMPKQGVVSMFSFGKGYGYWIMAATVIGYPVTIIPPREWKKHFGLSSNKEESIAKAKELFPGINLRPKHAKKDHDGMAEAALIAYYGAKKNERED